MTHPIDPHPDLDQPAADPPAVGSRLDYPARPADTVFFDGCIAFGSLNGVGQITVGVTRMGMSADGHFASDRVPVLHLRASVPALHDLRRSVDMILAAMETAGPGDVLN